MLTDDYLVRLTGLAIRALLRILGLIKEGHYEDALQLVDVTIEQLVGLRAAAVRSLDDERIFYLLTSHDQLDTRRLEVLADLLAREGDIFAAQQRGPESKANFSRALKFYLVVHFNETPALAPQVAPKIESLLEDLKLEELPPDVLWSLAEYSEQCGQFARAEAALLSLASRPDLKEQIDPELAAFYGRMKQKPPDEVT